MRSPASAPAMSRAQRDGARPLLRRRSPRGTVSRWREAPAREASNWRCWRSTVPARSVSSPPAAWRSPSGSRGPSVTGAGREPSARPRTTTRSRSRPTPMLNGPHMTPSPIRPCRAGSASRASSRARAKTSSPAGASTGPSRASRSRERSTRSAAFCSANGQRARQCSPPRRLPSKPLAHFALSAQGNAVLAAASRSSIRLSTNLRKSRARPASWRAFSAFHPGASGSVSARSASAACPNGLYRRQHPPPGKPFPRP